jgi:hypothetical protein
MLEEQQTYFKELHARVKKLVDEKKTAEQVNAEVDRIRKELQAQEPIRKYVSGSFAEHVQKVYVELGGTPSRSARATTTGEKPRHADGERDGERDRERDGDVTSRTVPGPGSSGASCSP